MTDMGDIKVDLENLRTWAEEFRLAFSDLGRDTILVQRTSTWRETPPTIRPPRLTQCFNCIPADRPTVTAGDLTDALARMRDWLDQLAKNV